MRLADWLLRRKGLEPDAFTVEDRASYRQRQYDRLADVVRGSLDLGALYRAMEEYEHG